MAWTTSWVPVIAERSSILLIRLFFFLTFVIASLHARHLFFQKHGWSHRFVGALHFIWMIYGSWLLDIEGQQTYTGMLVYDVVLGLLGITTTLTAAKDFPHKYVRNKEGQSGSLEERAIITQGEMIEHSFYQALNLWQALYLHFLGLIPAENNKSSSCIVRWFALSLVTCPWLIRRKFPVNSFSSNWKAASSDRSGTIESLLYKMKKSQYIFYKHVILHGVNLSIAVRPFPLVQSRSWRIFWLSLNASYVMEFFLQTMVKRGVISQSSLLKLNSLLMVTASVAAVRAVFGWIRWDLCIISILTNFVHRYHDMLNTTLLGGIAIALESATESWVSVV